MSAGKIQPDRRTGKEHHYYRGIEVSEEAEQVLRAMFSNGVRLQIHYEHENDQFVIASSITGIRAWPVERHIVDELVHKRLISHNPTDQPEDDGWYWQTY